MTRSKIDEIFSLRTLPLDFDIKIIVLRRYNISIINTITLVEYILILIDYYQSKVETVKIG